MDELQHGRIAIRPYDARKRTYAMPVMLFAYNICQRSDNARVGANCNSPIHCGQFAHPLRAIRPQNHQKDIKKIKSEELP